MGSVAAMPSTWQAEKDQGRKGGSVPAGYSPALQEKTFKSLHPTPTLRKAERVDTEARVTSDGPESQSWQREGSQVQLRLMYMTLSSGTPPSCLGGMALPVRKPQ